MDDAALAGWLAAALDDAALPALRALEALARSLADGGHDARTRLLELGALDRMAATLKLPLPEVYAMNPELIDASCALLWQLVEGSDAAAKACSGQITGRNLLALLKAYRDRPNTALPVCRLMAELGRFEKNSGLVARLDKGVGTVLAVAGAHPGDAAMQEACLRLLAHYAKSSENNVPLIAKADGLRLALHAVRAHSRHVGVLCAAFGMLGRCCRSDKHGASVGRLGGVALALRVAAEHAPFDNVAQALATFFDQATEVAANAALLADEGGEAALLDLVRHHPGSRPILVTACTVLWKLRRLTHPPPFDVQQRVEWSLPPVPPSGAVVEPPESPSPCSEILGTPSASASASASPSSSSSGDSGGDDETEEEDDETEEEDDDDNGETEEEDDDDDDAEQDAGESGESGESADEDKRTKPKTRRRKRTSATTTTKARRRLVHKPKKKKGKKKSKKPRRDLEAGIPLSARPSVTSVRPFVDEAEPTAMHAAPPCADDEPLFEPPEDADLPLEMMRGYCRRLEMPDALLNRVVFDACTGQTAPERPLPIDSELPPLAFESRFESGNLAKAVQVFPAEYDLVLMADVNTVNFTQWFYFSVDGMRAGVSYRFNVVNAEKPDSTFNYGMQPVMYSTRAARDEGLGWTRVGDSVCYVPNYFAKTINGKSVPCYTATWTYNPDFDEPRVFFAYCFPYTFSNALRDVQRWRMSPHARAFSLCQTLAGNEVPLLRITDWTAPAAEVAARKAIVLSARVHPGEVNASWIMRGIVDALLAETPEAARLRQLVTLDVVPMLNPDGVLNGNHRCNLAGLDLNRQWSAPTPEVSPTILALKTLIREVDAAQDLVLFVDVHGHSRKKNVFMFGCEGAGMAERVFPFLVSRQAACFAFSSCSFKVQKSKADCARVALWRELALPACYTLEASFCGADFGRYAGVHFSPAEYEAAGHAFVRAALQFVAPDGPALAAAERELEQMYPGKFNPERARRERERLRAAGCVETLASGGAAGGGGGGSGGAAGASEPGTPAAAPKRRVSGGVSGSKRRTSGARRSSSSSGGAGASVGGGRRGSRRGSGAK